MASKYRHFTGKKLILNVFFAAVILFGFTAKANEQTMVDHNDATEESIVVHDEHGAKEGHGNEEAPFDPTTIIFEHISDSHDWHFWGEHEHAVSLPLPIILYSDKGLDIFLSSKFEHGHASVIGKYEYRLDGNIVKALTEEGEEATIYDFSITKNVASMLISVLLLFWIFGSMASAYRKRGIVAPKGLQSFLEPLVLFIRDDVAKPNIGEKADRFLPFLLTIFFFIWINNLLGLLPIGANLTGNISFTMVLAVVTLIMTSINGNTDYWKHIFWMPGLAWPMKLFMAPIELIGIITKPFALMIRLFANITAGHIVVISLISLIFIFKSIAISPVSVAFALFIYILELLVAFLQAYIFTMLTALFIGSAVAEHSHEHGHEQAHH